MSNKQKLTDTEVGQVSDLLSRLDPGLYPFPIFVQVARLTTLTTIELVSIVDEPKSSPKVLLLQRPETDLWWPNLWHVPGSVLLPTDTADTYKDPLNRIIQGELDNSEFLVNPTFFRNHFRHEKRGPMNAIQHWSVLKDAPSVGSLFPINQVPENIVPEHVETVAMAAKEYERYLSQSTK